MSKTNPSERNALKKYLLDTFLTSSNDKIEDVLKKSAYFTKKEIETLKIQSNESPTPKLSDLALQSDWKVCDSSSKSFLL